MRRVVVPRLAGLSVLGAALGPFTVAAQPLPSLGPLTYEEGAPLQRLGLTPAMEAAAPVPKGATRTDLWIGYANVFEQDSAEAATVYLDMERLIMGLTARYGATDALEVGARATLESTWGGVLDPVVLTLHWGLGVGSRNRAHFPAAAYGQRLEDREGRVLVDIPRRSLALEDVRVFVKWRVFEHPDGRSTLSLRAVARLPTARNTVGEERADLALLALTRASWWGMHLHGMAGGTTVRRSPELEGVLRASPQWLATAAIERPLREGLSAVLAWSGSTQLLRDYGDYDVSGFLSNTIVGLVGRTGRGWRWELSLQEDSPPWGPSTDFTLQAGLARTW